MSDPMQVWNQYVAGVASTWGMNLAQSVQQPPPVFTVQNTVESPAPIIVSAPAAAPVAQGAAPHKQQTPTYTTPGYMQTGFGEAVAKGVEAAKKAGNYGRSSSIFGQPY